MTARKPEKISPAETNQETVSSTSPERRQGAVRYTVTPDWAPIAPQQERHDPEPAKYADASAATEESSRTTYKENTGHSTEGSSATIL